MTVFGTALAAAPLAAERLDIGDTPQELFAKVNAEYENAFLLESARGNNRLSEYSFIGFGPSMLVSAKDSSFEVSDLERGSKERVSSSDPLGEIRKLVPPNTVSGLFRFIGGAVGYVSYDAIRCWERLPSRVRDGMGFPDLEFGVYTDGVVYDHAKHESYYYSLGKSRLDEVMKIARRSVESGSLRASKPHTSCTETQFQDMVVKAKEYISAGDIFQVVLSNRKDFEVGGDLGLFYSELSRINPSPYMYHLKFGERRIVGSSPEMLLRVEDRRIETFPIAGTRPHLDDAKENAKLTEELLADPKENAEHVMLVDLARNDVGRVSAYGSVRTQEFLTVQQFSHVQHIVSHVTGELRDGLDSYDALKALFPAGTVSGAPKVRAMEIIDELEPTRRGPYAGAVGYFSFNGNADFAITIRTLVKDHKRCSIQAGAGIVADSTPEREWHETEAKGAGLMKAIELAENAKA